ncbi:MAG: DUF1800 domain-containing protein [Chitinophagaceae bacterium]|nr:DUF1800 domain-containing protein [Chitinophagaceae bacterium]
MPDVKQRKNIHLLWRAGFGPSVTQLNSIDDYSSKHIWNDLVKTSAREPQPYNTVDNYIMDMMMDAGTPAKLMKREMTVAEKKMIREKNRQSIADLNLRWINDIVSSEAQLREKAAFFWHGHFACRSLSALYQQQLLNTIRSNAIGNFRELLFAVSKSAAMINFLNNNQNKKNHPNENFAREVMELFTLGRGNYSEQDVKEAARAFTGWGANAQGEFIFRKQQHDDGVKNFLGRTGNFNGDDILNILLEQKQTALFIAKKMYRFFVNENVDNDKVQHLANDFYKGGYDVQQLFNDIFSAGWFYEEKNTGTRIKSPIELIVGIQRMLPMEVENKNFFLLVQRVLGQLLMYPPNVAGWPGGKAWIDSSTLMVRMRLPKILSEADVFNVKPKNDDDQMMGMKDSELKAAVKHGKKKINLLGKEVKASIDWHAYLSSFDKIKKEDLTKTIARLLLQTNDTISGELIKQYSVIDSREQFIKTATIQIMSMPEYQMC